MPNPFPLLLQKAGLRFDGSAPPFLLRLRQEIAGLAEDFWNDGSENLFGFALGPLFVLRKKSNPDARLQQKQGFNLQPAARAGLWHAEPGEISEKMWGDGFVTPGAGTINNLLIKPLGLTSEMSVLDLSAGLGGRMRFVAEETGAYITGLEPDAAVAARGMRLSMKAGKAKHAPIAHYDPARLALNRSYDCVIARETFYRAPDRPGFFASLGRHTKPNAQIAYTDYILDPEHREAAAIQAWKKNEKLADPMGLVEAAESWATAGFSLRLHEDLTDLYKTEVRTGMKRLMDFLASGIRPDQETADSLLRRIETWKCRLAAMEAGMKFYRFYGIKH